MFLDFFHLREQPFGDTPDPRFLFMSKSHREALATLYCGIQSGHSLLALIAPPGLGKTTLLHRLIGHLGQTTRAVFHSSLQSDSSAFLRSLLIELRAPSPGSERAEVDSQLRRFFLAEHEAGRRVVLCIDEAQCLDDSTLECLRLLTNVETRSAKPVQIVLAGQPPLAELLSRPSLSQLLQRISAVARLQTLSPEETTAYIYHRLRIAGYSGPDLFDSDALELIARASRGIPRRINMLCSGALAIACALRRSGIDRSMICEAISDLDLQSLSWAAPSHPVPAETAPVARPEPYRQARSRIVIGRRQFRSALGVAALMIVSLLTALGWAWNDRRFTFPFSVAGQAEESSRHSPPSSSPRTAR